MDRASGWYKRYTQKILVGVGLVIALVLFRIFDMTKPWPIRRIERLPGGYGVVYDDVVAGLIALALGLLLQDRLF